MSDKKRFERAGRKMDSALGTAANRIQKELAEAVEYMNDEVVPKVRKGSTGALRIAAKKLAKLADYMEKQRR